MEMLFKLRLNLYKQKHESVLRDTRYDQNDVDQSVGLHCIFATASPVLTGEVKRYYSKLTDQIKEELQKKRDKDLAKRRQEQEQQLETNLEQSAVHVIDKAEAKLKEDQYFTQQIEGIKLKEDQKAFDSEDENDDVDDEEMKLKQEMDKYGKFQDMKDEDFPAFFTIRKLLLMIDGSLKRPFFSRNQDDKIIGSTSQAQWHNESSGIMMINHFKSSTL